MVATGYKNPGTAVQFTDHMSTPYPYDNITDIKSCDDNYTSQSSSGGVNNTHVGPDAIVWGFNFGIHLNARIDSIDLKIRRMKNTYQGGVEDSVVKLREGSSSARNYMGNNRYSTSDWPTKTLSNKYYSGDSSYWGVTLTPARVNDWYFGFGMRPVGTSSTWALAAIDCMQMNVNYTMPTYGWTRTLASSALLNQNFTYTIKLSNTNGVHQGYDIPCTITLPAGVSYVSHSTSNGSYNPSTGKFTAALNSNGEATLTLTLKGTTVGNKTIVASVDGFSTTNSGVINILNPTPTYTVNTGGDSEMELGEWGTITVAISGARYDSETIYFDVDHDFDDMEAAFVSSSNLSNVAYDDGAISCNVTNTTTGAFTLSYSFYVSSLVQGAHTLSVFERSTSEGDIAAVEVTFDGLIDALGYGTQIKKQIFPNASGLVIIDQINMQGAGCQVSTECRAQSDIIKGFIGPIRLDRPHSMEGLTNTSKNTLIKEGYKNRINVGKKGDFEEDIPLKIRLPVADAITLQGLVEFDEPVPINTWAAADDGNLLNHRGYAVIYNAKMKYLNSQRYDCDIDLYYLTRNLDPPIYVRRLSQVNRYDVKPMYVSRTLDTATDSLDDYFTVWYDGTRSGNEFTVTSGGGSPLKLRSTNLIATPLNLKLTWESEMSNIDYVYRYFRVLNEDNEVIFEYRIYTYEISTGVYQTYALVTVHDEDGSIENEDYEITLGEDGPQRLSSTVVNITGNVLSLIEEGESGIELALDTIILPKGNYRVEYEVKHEYPTTSTTTIDFEIDETFLLSNLREQFINQIVSSFPLKGKEIQYTREAEDGLLYYYKHDEEVAKYYAQPFVIYKGGTNITTEAGGSILSNRYKVDPIVLTNGLVKVVFSKALKTIVLYYYDALVDEGDKWVYISTFKLENMENTYVNEITQDKASIKCGETIWTIWRGRPWVDVNHTLQDLKIATAFTSFTHDDGTGAYLSESVVTGDEEIAYNSLFYADIYDDSSDYGLLVIRPGYDSIYVDRIPRSAKTVLAPVDYADGKEHDQGPNLAVEWLNMYEQRIEIMR